MSKIIEIPLTKGMFALINEEDFELVSSYKWYASKGKNTYYAHHKRLSLVSMHRLIMGVTDSKIFVDHKNRNGLDNTRINLRLATHIQNNCNKCGYKNRSSTFKGVYWNKEKMKWTCQITPPGEKTRHIGHFKSEIAAAMAFNEAALRYHGEFAYINQIIPI